MCECVHGFFSLRTVSEYFCPEQNYGPWLRLYIHKLVLRAIERPNDPKSFCRMLHCHYLCCVLLSHLLMKLGFATALCKDESAKVQVSFDGL